jgi:hypothetical protein
MQSLHDALMQVLAAKGDIIIVLCSFGVHRSVIFAVLLAELSKAILFLEAACVVQLLSVFSLVVFVCLPPARE